MVFTAALMVLLPSGSPRYIYPLIAVPCVLLGRALTVEDGSSTPDWLVSIWRRLNLLLLATVSLGVAAMPLFARGDRWIYFWTCIEGLPVLVLWFFALANRPRSPHVPPATSSRLVAQAILTGAIAALAMMILAILVMPRIDSANKHRSREVAGAIRAALPAGAQLWVLEDSYRPFWYYLEPDVRYFHSLSDLPAQANYLLLPATQTTGSPAESDLAKCSSKTDHASCRQRKQGLRSLFAQHPSLEFGFGRNASALMRRCTNARWLPSRP